MKQEIKGKWLAALRSSEYKQGIDYLNNHGDFCCLGVLCDLAVKEGVIEAPTSIGFPTEYGHGWNSQSSVLPDAVVKWAGVKDENPSISDPDNAMNNTLALVNDSGRDFDYIANLIEEQL